MTMRRRRAGLTSEKLAVEHLREKGYNILRRNYRCSFGELDIIAADGPVLVFVEVRSRSGKYYGRACESLSKAKQARLRKLALYYVAVELKAEVPCRCDLLAVDWEAGHPHITHIQNI